MSDVGGGSNWWDVFVVIDDSGCCLFFEGSIDGTVRCWDTRSRNFKPIQVLDDARDSISSLNVVQHEILTGWALWTQNFLLQHQIWSNFVITESILSAFKMWGLFPCECCVCRSVDGKVRCYDLRMGQLRVDSINSNCPSFNISAILQINHTSLYGTRLR